MRMEDLVALCVRTKSGKRFGVMTLGRIGSATTDEWLVNGYLHSLRSDEREEIANITLCDSLRDARKCKYFYEGFFSFSIAGIPYGSGYENWRNEKERELKNGTFPFYGLGDWED